MMRVLIAWVLLLAVAGCKAADVADKLPDAKQRAAAEERYLKGLDELRKQFNEKEYGKARIVPKGAKPEIILKDGVIMYNSKPLLMGAPLQDWKDIISAPHRCVIGKYQMSPTVCTWDGLGLKTLTSSSNKNIVASLTIFINPRPADPFNIDSAGISDTTPKNSFQGYFELDNFGIDSKTKFWEIRTNVKTERKLSCGVRDCTHPGGLLTEGQKMYLRLNQNSEHGQLYEFSIDSDL
jgi:hypothetical protein